MPHLPGDHVSRVKNTISCLLREKKGSRLEMPLYTVKLIGREEVAKATMAFHFEKPDGFVYKAGQFGDFTLHRNPASPGETGHITRAMLERYVDDLTVSLYYCTGPAPLVTAMRNLLTEAGVDDDMIRTEEFTGYRESAMTAMTR